MLFLEEGLVSSHTRHADEQQRVSSFRDTEASADWLSGARKTARVQKESACNQSKFFNSGKEACYRNAVVHTCSSALLRAWKPSVPGNCTLKFPFCSAANMLPFALVPRSSWGRGVVRELLYLAGIISPWGIITSQCLITGKMKK